MDDIAARGHVIVQLDDDRVVFLREVSAGSVRYIAPGLSTEHGETPGHAAVRAARHYLGIEVVVAELVFADTEMGSEHFFFLATPTTPPARGWDEPQPTSDGAPITTLKRSGLLAYPIRPHGVARRLRRRAATPMDPTVGPRA